MPVFQGPQFDSLKSQLKKEFPLDTKNPELCNQLHIQLHRVLDEGSSKCSYYISSLLMPTDMRAVPPEKIDPYKELYENFMKLHPTPVPMTPVLNADSLVMA